MSETTPYRALGEPFLAALEALATAPHGGWWADVLGDPELLLAVRDRSLNVYYRGASLFRITPAGGGVAAETHVKYLVRQRQVLTRLGQDGSFGSAPSQAVWDRYEGPATLAEMKRAAVPLAGLEKTGLHVLVQTSPNVVDVEIALAGAPVTDAAAEPDGSEIEAAQLASETTTTARLRQDRLDVASLEERGVAGEAWLVFHEAKLATNPALRSRTTPAIVEQMKRYRATLKQEAERLTASYPALCRDLVSLEALRRKARTDRGLDVSDLLQRDPLINDVASGRRILRIDTEPRLVVFGFDADQRDKSVQAITQDLSGTHGLRVYAVGRPVKGTPAFRRPSDLQSDAT
ncbi:hypothetical protein [Methylobacterium oryzihabitans]|uniref:Uncharacterized protein n=1 Tax=Methylobacterium oryzihabitans TaxID=2499852 RepID=A0A437NVX2_9HYPH|nr:hypothetical protein [Methylobacterium oryzihabitans]RVU14181.1 hypothetical protein EOE48_24240 [Methylobacterium oryzihabitans]